MKKIFFTITLLILSLSYLKAEDCNDYYIKAEKESKSFLKNPDVLISKTKLFLNCKIKNELIKENKYQKSCDSFYEKAKENQEGKFTNSRVSLSYIYMFEACLVKHHKI